MRLKAVEMQGFKSFPDKTKITFESGVTCIIGPNGSGKSNISDAVRWVLGEMSMKSLRGSKMEDVIFNGTPARPAANCAIVSLYIDTEEEYRAQHQITIEELGEEGASPDDKPRLSDMAETVITRKYYRSGESEYYINHNQCRLRDIYDIFFNTGIGREGYSVISQGKIAEVLSQKGDERRAIFEEASGISRFRYQKTAAERKLADTEQNLLRLNDILSEVASRVKPLEKEAENAKKYKAYYDEKMGLEITLWLNSLDELREKRKKGEAGLEEVRSRLQNADDKQKQAEEALDACLNESYESSRLISLTEQEKSVSERIKAEAESEGAVCRNDLEHFAATIQESNAAIKEAEAQSALSAQLINAAEKSLADAKAEADATETNCNEKELAWQNARSAVAKATEDADAAEQNLNACRSGVAELAAREAALQAELDASRRSAQESDERIAAGRDRIAQLESAKKEAEARLDAAQDAYLAELKVAKNLREQGKQALAEEETLKEKIVTIRLQVTAAEQRRESLRRMEQLLEGYSDSVRTVLKDGGEGRIKRKDGSKAVLHGPVSNILSADNEYVVALETALGASAQFIVVESAEDAKASIRYLKENHAGRATFLPLDTVNGNLCDVSAIKSLDGYIGIASDLCQYDKKYGGVVADLLGHTVLATDMDSAQKIAAASKFKLKIVTLDGQVIHPGGSFTGGSVAKKVGVFTRAMDIERLSGEIREHNAQLLKLEQEASHLRTKAEKAEEDAVASDLAAEEKKAAFDALDAEVNGFVVRMEEEESHIAAIEAGRNAGDDGRKDLETRLADVRKEASVSGETIASAEDATTKAKQILESARAAETASYDALSQEKIVLISKRANADGLAAQLSQLTSNLSAIVERISALRATITASESSISDRNNRLVLIDEKIAAAQKGIEAAEAKLTALFGSREEQEEKLAGVRNAVKEAQTERDALFIQVTEEETNFQRVNENFDNLTAKLYDEYELTYTDAEKYRLPEEQMDHAPSRLASLKAKIRSMGVINVNAVEEYRQVKERFDFLSTQIDDLQKTRRSLDNTIAKLEQQMKESFVDTFNAINEKFNEVFIELFGGGSARIEMDDPDRPLECGIDIILRLPGKSVKSISLLSGGEQSFAAIALYLALQAVNPAPFCIFDEIESALDEINVNKFGDYIKAHSEKTQYIAITHRRGTMEHADTLYGVTMHQKGISDYIRLNLSKMEENFKEYSN